MIPTRRERKNPELEAKLIEYGQWARTYGGYHGTSTIQKQISTIRRFGEICDMLNPKMVVNDVLDELVKGIGKGDQASDAESCDIRHRSMGEIPGSASDHTKIQGKQVSGTIDTHRLRLHEDKEGSPFIQRQGKCFQELMHCGSSFSGGMRIGELIRLNLKHVDGNLLTIMIEKREAPRIRGLPQSLAERLHEYIDRYRSKSDPVALFTTEKGRLNYNWERNIIKLIAKKAGVPKFHAHAARHWCGTALLRDGKDGRRLDIREVQIQLGHASLASTQVYTHIKSRELSERASEHMEEFFRMNKISLSESNLHGTDLELDGTADI